MKFRERVMRATRVAAGCASGAPRFCYLDRMRVAVILAFGLTAAACGDPYEPGPGFPYPDGGGYPPGTGAPCTTSAECAGGDVCARDHECLAPGDARSVLVRWTVGGQPANATSCAPVVAAGQLEIQYVASATGELTGFAPLMCDEGQFFVDIWPARFDMVTVAVPSQNGTGPLYTGSTALGATGNQDVTVDLEPPP